MRRIVLAAVALFSLNAHADELKTFADVASALSQGKKITFVMDLQQCRADKPLPAVVGSVTPNAIMMIASERITASDRHFTLNNPAAAGTAVFEYSKYDIRAEGSVSIKATTLDAANYQQLASVQVDCGLGEGFRVFAGG